MALDQYYEKVAGDELTDTLIGEKSKIIRAPPTPAKRKRSLLTTIGIGALLVTLFLAAVVATSAAVVSYRLPAATKAALAAQQSPVTDSDKSLNNADSGNNDDRPPIHAEEPSISPDIPFVANFYNKTVPMRSCGGTPDEARAAGCVFDVMMQLWTPPECYDEPLSERFLANGNWTWYADNEASRVYSDEEIRLGNHAVVFVAQSYHRHHCIFAWERLVRAMRNQGPLIEELISYDHVMHCRHKTLTLPSEGAEAVRGVVAPTGYTRCASYDIWVNDLPANKVSSTEKRWII